MGEASNSDTRHPVHRGARARAAALLPDLRLVSLVRDPWARLASRDRRRLSTGYEPRPAARALHDDPSYVATSLYGMQLAEWRRHFPAAQILVLQSEALFADPGPQLARLAGHLGVAHDPGLPYEGGNATEHRRVVASPLRHLSRRPFLRRPVKRLGRAVTVDGRWGWLWPRGGSAAAAKFELPAGQRAEIARLFAEDRQRLVDLAGEEVVRGWRDDRPGALGAEPAPIGQDPAATDAGTARPRR